MPEKAPNSKLLVAVRPATESVKGISWVVQLGRIWQQFRICSASLLIFRSRLSLGLTTRRSSRWHASSVAPSKVLSKSYGLNTRGALLCQVVAERESLI